MREKHFHTLEILVLGYAGAVIGLNASRIIGGKAAKSSIPLVAKLGRAWLGANTFGSAV